ncbi:hypothetical protein EMPS_03140 [Entomortierella parvispora]|uniref:Uncharacterized protein n=1 Tax=Entomortierella parvispora TaxID=205924 RepID=A0A9P3H683_9FUNG|nr:hypothetical protein EMPS_03140 [Entomortierella parvispora]
MGSQSQNDPHPRVQQSIQTTVHPETQRATNNIDPSILPGYTAAPLPNHQLSTRCCCISLHGRDMLTLTHFPRVLVQQVRAILLKFSNGIQDEYEPSRTSRSDPNIYCTEFKLRGCPWQGGGSEGVMARRMICQLMKMMAQRGWNLIQAADISKHEHSMDVMFFESQVREDTHVVDSSVEMFAVSFNRTDCIRIMDCSSMVPLVRATIQKYWTQGIQSDGKYCGAYQFQLRGNPFYTRGSEEVRIRMLLCQILTTIRNQGFKLYSSVDLSRGGEDGRDLESWMFRKVGPAWS